jgi:acetylornithine deacetylase/succinyl-diaminopimelate desuccinylase-like protein
MTVAGPEGPDGKADEGPFPLLAELVSLAPTNLEDPAHGREDKHHYPETAELLRSTARRWGLPVRVWDAREGLAGGRERFASPRPNVIVELNLPSPRTLLILAHYDVVPVPEEQRERWLSPPHTLTARANGRWYGRGSNDDLGSGVVASLRALHRLSHREPQPVGVRLLLSPDEETGGAGGIEALVAHDEALPVGSPERFLLGEAAFLPDGSPYVAAGSSGVCFLDVGRVPPGPLEQFVALARGVEAFHQVAQEWRSSLPAPDFPHGGGRTPTIPGRATVTRMEVAGGTGGGPLPRLKSARAESEAANQIAGAVTLRFVGSADGLENLGRSLREQVREPYSVRQLPGSKEDPLLVQVVGRAGHGGYPHRAANPVSEALRLLESLLTAGVLDGSPTEEGTLTVDLRSPPEMEVGPSLESFRRFFEPLRQRYPGARFGAPAARQRAGYFLAPDHPVVTRVQRTYESVTGHPVGIFGEYGGTDASALRRLRTPEGRPLPAVVFGSMDEEAHIHDAEESVDPRRLAEVEELLYRLVSEWPAG